MPSCGGVDATRGSIGAAWQTRGLGGLIPAWGRPEGLLMLLFCRVTTTCALARSRSMPDMLSARLRASACD